MHHRGMRLFAILVLPVCALIAAPVAAQSVTYETVTVVEEVLPDDSTSQRFVAIEPVPLPRGLARFGPFRVLDPGHAALTGATDERSPAQFAAMLGSFPGIVTLEMIECPGTLDDRANLQIGRMIHARGIATHVPAGGSVRSGGVELFLAGTRRIADPGAEFAIHAWADDAGREPGDYPPDGPENRAYLDYYREMGMSSARAAAFYAMTNSVANADAKWLTAADMQGWLDPENPPAAPAGSLDLNRAVH